MRFFLLLFLAGPLRAQELGMNLSAVNDWNREWVFVDAFKHARPWISQTAAEWDDGRMVETDAAGWPILKAGQSAGTLMFRDMDGHYPAGVYLCSFDGSGELSFGLDAAVIERRKNRILVRVVPGNGGIYLRIDRSDPSDPVRSLRVLLPGFEHATSPFHPLFVERLRPFKVLRFMDWQATNGSPPARWSQRTTPGSVRQSGPGGVALEYQIDLANQLGADPWFCVPHLADDDYVRQFATLVRERLHAGGKIYVEWSNEAWNSLFPQSRWVQAEAARRGASAAQVIADQARRDWRIWREVFSDAPERIVRVAAGHQDHPGFSQQLLERLDGELDALACGAYFYARDEDVGGFDAGTTPDQVLKSARRQIREHAQALYARHGALAKEWSGKLGRSLPLLAYEGGQHLSTGGVETPYLHAYLQAQKLPLMGEVYRENLDAFRAAGGGLFVAFAYAARPTKWGAWGHLESQDQPLSAAPKLQALLGEIH